MNQNNDNRSESQQSSLLDFLDNLAKNTKEAQKPPTNIIELHNYRKNVSLQSSNSKTSVQSAIDYAQSLDW